MLEVHHLSAGYGGKSVLKDLSFSIRRGELLGVLGQNGSGKTTLLRCLAGVLAPLSGKILLQGQDLAHIPSRQRARLIACVPQRATLPGELTVLDFVLLGRYPHLSLLGRYKAHDYAACERALELTGTSAFRHRYMKELSGGEQQRILLALALAQESPLLLLDELGSHVDLPGLLSLYGLLRELVSEGYAIISVMHDVHTAFDYSTRLLGIRDGQLLFDAASEAAVTDENLSELYGLPITVACIAGRRFAYPLHPRGDSLDAAPPQISTSFPAKAKP